MKALKLSIVSLLFLVVFTATVEAADIAKIIFSPAGKVVAGKAIRVDVFVDSNVHVNAAQLNITYPVDEITLSGVDSANSKFSIKAEETISPGMIKIARGNVRALKGKNLLVSITVVPKTVSALGKLSYSQSDSLVMSKDNVNVLSGSQVLTVKPVESTTTTETDQGIATILKKAVKEFFRGLFGR